MDTHDLFFRFGVALAIGILIGLQREYAEYTDEDQDGQVFAGVRTFSLIGLAGAVSAMLADIFASPWVFVGVIFVLGLLIAAAYTIIAWRRNEVGLTTEVAALLAFLAGALCYWDQLALAVALGVATTVLLALKLELHTFVRRITREDIFATLRFAVITAVVLPVLPNRAFGAPPLDVLNPYRIWLMVVLISGISFLGYVLIKIVGARRGIGLTGILGGLVSSTAVTLSFAQRSQIEMELSRPFALAITVGWTMMFSRVLIEVAVLNRALLEVLWPPLVAAGAVGLLYCAYLYYGQRFDDHDPVTFSNPFDLWPAMKFGLLFAGVLLVSRAAQVYLGDPGIYLSSVVTGMADVDAITLSLAQMSGQGGEVDLTVAERAIVLAAMANTAVKGGIVLAVGTQPLRRALWPAFALMLVTGLSVAFLG